MKDASKGIRKGTIEKLAAINGVHFYDQMLPINRTDQKYILLTTQTMNGNRSKLSFKPDCTLVIDVNVRANNPTGKLECDDIADQVLQLLNPISSTDYIDLGVNFQCVRVTVLQNETLHLLTNTQHNYRRLIRLQYSVLEK